MKGITLYASAAFDITQDVIRESEAKKVLSEEEIIPSPFKVSRVRGPGRIKLRDAFAFLTFILLISSCNSEKGSVSEEMPLLYSAPISVPLNTEEGYVLNQLTGDSIQPLINSSGDTLRTGVPIRVTGKVVPAGKPSQSLAIKADDSKVVPAHPNVHPIPKDPVIIPVNIDSLINFTPSADRSSFVLLNSKGDTIPTGIPVAVTGKAVTCTQPPPVKALPFRMKDHTSLNLRYLDVDQGMNASGVISILEDSRGNLWFGTIRGGASKYDGVSFTHYTREEGLSQTVLSMLEDSHGNLWFGTGEDGAIMFDGETFTHYSDKQGLSSKPVFCILEDRQGNLWFGIDGEGVCMFDGVSIIHFTVKEGLGSNDVRSMLEDSNGNLWFGHQGEGVSRYDGSAFTRITGKDGLASYVNCMMEDRDGNLWFGAGGEGATVYNGETFTHFYEGEGFFSYMTIMSMLEDQHGEIYFGTMGGGVSKYDGHAFTRITEEEGLSDNTVWSMLEDSHGNIWFGTDGGGVCLYQSGAFSSTTTREGLSANEVTSILEDRWGALWFGTVDKGMNRYDGEIFTHFTYGQKIVYSSDDYYLMYVDNIGPGLVDRQGNHWFGTYGAGIGMYRDQTITYYTEQEGLSSDYITSILEDRQGNLWVGTDGRGVCMFDGFTFTHLTEKEGLTNSKVYAIMEDAQGNLWFGTSSGAYRYNGEAFTLFSEKEGLSNNTILSILEDSRGYIWFGTGYGGACVYQNESFTIFTEKEGLSNNTVYSIQEDLDHNIWLGTEQGLNHLVFDREDTTTSTFTNPIIQAYGTQDGLTSNDFYTNSAFLDSKNRMWWGTDKGLIMLDMNKFTVPSEPPAVQLDHLEINDQFIDFRHWDETNRRNPEFSGVAGFYNYPLNLKLPYRENHLAFHFSAVDWSALHKIKYSYKMENFDDNWSNPASESNAVYRNLPFGTYTFKLRAVGGAQIWSSPFEYTFTVLSPPWFRWWAYLIYGSLFILLVLWYRRFLLNRAQLKTDLELEKVQKEKVQELNRMKTRFFTNISHEFRTPLTLLLGPLEDILGNSGERIEAERGVVEMMKRNAARLQRLVNQLLEISKLESGKMRITVSEGDLTGTIRTMANAFLSLAESKKITYIIDTPKENSSRVFDHDKLEKILTNLLSNAFKYTPRGGTVKLTLDYKELNNDQDEQRIIIRVQDTGRGIAEDQLPLIFDRFSLADAPDNREDDSMGIGLSLTKELVELLNGTIEVNSEVGKGTEFMVALPVSTGTYPAVADTEMAFQTEEEVIPANMFEPSLQSLGMDESLNGIRKLNKTEILVVEDNEDLRNYISGKLASEYSIIEAVNGREGLKLTRENIPDLVISDLMMPVMGGMELCRELKNDERTSHIPIIILTAKSDKPSKLEGLATGADDYISKPFDAEELQVRVRNLITQRKKLRELFRKQLIEPESPTDKRVHGDKLIERLLDTFENNYFDYDFSVDDMGKELLMSRAQFYRKVNALTGSSPNELLRLFRLRKAATLLESEDLNITSIMYEVGFRSTSHFAESFRKYYGKNPSEYRESLLRGK